MIGEPCQQLGGYKTTKTQTAGKMSIKFCKNEGHGEMHLENSFCMHQGNLDSNTADERLTDAYAAASKGSVPEKKVCKKFRIFQPGVGMGVSNKKNPKRLSTCLEKGRK